MVQGPYEGMSSCNMSSDAEFNSPYTRLCEHKMTIHLARRLGPIPCVMIIHFIVTNISFCVQSVVVA